MLSQMKKEKIAKALCAAVIIGEFAYMSYLLMKLYIFLYPGQSWQAVLGFVILGDVILSNAILFFKKK